MQILISPSILSADFANLGAEVAKLEACGADYIHIDVMDGHFVPNLTIGPQVIKFLRPHTRLPFDVHLMIDNPDLFIPAFREAGSDMITIHLEATPHIHRTLAMIRNTGAKVGVSICPATHERQLEYIYDMVDRILVMTVNPGFGGQPFIESQLRKIAAIRTELTKRHLKHVELAVDGGINPHTAKQVVKSGANVLIAGKAIMHSDDYKSNMGLLRGA